MMLSAKAKVDNRVARTQLAVAQSLIATQQAHISGLQRRLATDAKRPKRDKTLKPVHPSIALEIAYREKLQDLIDQMQSSVLYWLRASYRANEPKVAALAQDVLPAKALRDAVRKLAARWESNFDEAALKLAEWFAQRVHTRSTQVLHKILRDGGWTVNPQRTRAQQDIIAAAIAENVSLIRSVPSQYFTQIEGMVMRSVMTGRDLQQLTNDLQHTFRVTRKRAILIARDQNNKVTSAITNARQIELGLGAIWMHSGAGKHPRPTHVRNNGKPYDPRKGWWDPAVKRYIWPGTEINCRCFTRSVIPGFS